MAAVICTSIGDLCRGCTNILCVAPCKACGVTCDACCSGISKVVMSPFFPYLLVTYVLNIPPLVLGIQSVSDLATAGCAGGAQWLLINAALCLVHLLASLYVVHKIRKDEHETAAPVVTASAYGGTDDNKIESGTVYHHMVTPADDTPSSSWGRIKHVLCFDKGVALYIVVAVVWIVWQTMGLSRYFALNGACGAIGGRMMTALFCGWFYMSMVGIAFLCSLCCLKL